MPQLEQAIKKADESVLPTPELEQVIRLKSNFNTGQNSNDEIAEQEISPNAEISAQAYNLTIEQDTNLASKRAKNYNTFSAPENSKDLKNRSTSSIKEEPPSRNMTIKVNTSTAEFQQPDLAH